MAEIRSALIKKARVAAEDADADAVAEEEETEGEVEECPAGEAIDVEETEDREEGGELRPL